MLKVDFAIEGIGAPVHERTIELHAVDRWRGGIVRSAWRKVHRSIEAERERLGSPSVGEW